MMLHTDTPTSPWFVVESDIKKHARLNVIAHLLSSIPYTEVLLPTWSCLSSSLRARTISGRLGRSSPTCPTTAKLLEIRSPRVPRAYTDLSAWVVA